MTALTLRSRAKRVVVSKHKRSKEKGGVEKCNLQLDGEQLRSKLFNNVMREDKSLANLFGKSFLEKSEPPFLVLTSFREDQDSSCG